LEETSSNNKGVNHLMELLAFSGTPTMDATTFQTTLDNLGGVSFASSSREQFLYCIDVLRPNLDQAMGMLKDVVLHPRLDDGTVEDMKRVIEFQWMDMVPEVVLGEGLQIAGYGARSKDGQTEEEQQQLGKSHFCPLESLPLLTADTVRSFRDAHLLNPKSMVVAGAGIEHEKLCELADSHFGHLTSNSTDESNFIIPSTYTGGSHKQILPTPDGMTRVALAFETGGWHSNDLVPACVLQTLLGGGNSFSAGGPGKGMYSRLYRQVLNRYYWAESCEAFTSFHTESGLLGISGSSIPQKSGDVTRVLAENLFRLAIEEVSDEELDRARNMLKCNVLTQLESRLVLFEDLGRQILTYGKRENTKQMCDKIDAVDKKTIQELVYKSIKGNKPTLCAVGDNVNFVPPFEDVEGWFKNI
jgi:processing peptidase subunit alpha